MKKAWTVLMFVFSCAFAQAQPYAGGVYPVKMLINSNPNPAGTPTWIPWNGKIEPTVTPTSTPTWNATTTRTQPPTPTATATNTPVMGQSEVRYMRPSDHPTETSYQVVPTTSPTAIVIPATTPGYHNKLEIQVQVPETGTGFFVFTRNGIMENCPPGFRGTIYPLCVDNGPMTIQCGGGVTGTIGRLNIYRAIVQDGH